MSDADRQAIAAALQDLGARRRFANDELWLDHHCLFHDDSRSSASFQPDTGVYYCRTEDRRYPIPDVLQILSLPVSEPAASAADYGRRRAQRLLRHPRPQGSQPQRTTRRSRATSNGRHGQPEATYEYYFPDGRLSHRKHRIGEGEEKEIWQEGPDGSTTLPIDLWPIYGDHDLEPGAALLVVEGEKAVDILNALGDSFRQHPIHALTTGSANDLRRRSADLADRILELRPAYVLLFPDQDEPGAKAMDAVAAELRDVGVPHQRVRPRRLGLAAKTGCDDWVEQGNSLADLFAQFFNDGGATTLGRVVSATPVTASQAFVFPGTRRLAKISPEMCKALLIRETGQMPGPRESEELAARLRLKSFEAPARVVYRLATADDCFWWRPAADGLCYRVDREGTTFAEDPPDTILAMPGENPRYSVAVDEAGEREDLRALCNEFHLNPTEVAMIEGWLVSLFCGLQAPIMLMRGPAATGKSTLARLIMAVVEPLVPHLDIKERGFSDQRELVRALERSPGLVLDNVSRMSSEMEDMLSKLVTGMTTPIRTLYEDSIELLQMSRGIIITTTTWDVYKGDLATRMVVVQPATDSALNWRSDRAMTDDLGGLIPLIRGHIFKRCARVYRQRHKHEGRAQPFRIGDLGVVFASLGYDVEDLARRESAAKAEVIAINDPWIEAIVALWKEEDSVSFAKTTSEVCDWLEDYGCADVPHPQSPKIARWLGEKTPIFRDHGFSLEPIRKAAWRGYRFFKAVPGETEAEE